MSVDKTSNLEPAPETEGFGQDKSLNAWVVFEISSRAPTDDNPYGVGWGIFDKGWDFFLETHLKPAYDYGFRHFMLHRPVGETEHTEPGDFMDFDARVDIIEDDHPFKEVLSEESLSSFLTRVKYEMPGCRVIPYFGSLRDPDFEDRVTAHNFSGWLDRFRRAMIPWINFDHVWPAFDHASSYEADGLIDIDGPNWQAIEMMESLYKEVGKHVFIEAFPYPEKAEKISFSAICLERFWQRYIEFFPNWKEVLTGKELVRWWSGHAWNEGWFDRDVVAWAADVTKKGMTPALSWGAFMNKNQSHLIADYPMLADFEKAVFKQTMKR